LLARTGSVAIALMWLPANAQESVTYQYDSLGRLKGAAISGGSNDAVVTISCFDAAGNRVQYLVGSTASALSCSEMASALQAPVPSSAGRPAAPATRTSPR